MNSNEHLLNVIASFIVSDYGVLSLLIVSMISYAIVFYRMSKTRHGPEMIFIKAFNATVVPLLVAVAVIVYAALNTSQIHESSKHKIDLFYDRYEVKVYDTHNVKYDSRLKSYVAEIDNKSIYLDKYDDRVNEHSEYKNQVLRLTTYKAKETKRELLEIWHKPLYLYEGELIDKSKEN